MKLSIITINKNNAAGLEKTCLSVVKQTYEDYEWIIIDGASEDDSVDIIKKYSYKATYWVSESDSGVYNAMNKGIKISTGEYLLFLNSGDFLLYPWTLQEVIDEIKESKYADIYYSDFVLGNYQIIKYPSVITLDFLIKSTISHQNSLIRKELFKHQLYSEKFLIISDWYFYIKELIDNNISFCHIKTNIAIVDINGISSQTKLVQTERKVALNQLHIIRNYKLILFFLIKVFKYTRYFLPYGFFRLYNLIKIRYKNNKITS